MELHAQIACRLPDKVEIIDAGPMAELVYYRTCLRCREYLTDGRVARAHVARWFVGIPNAAKHLDKLVAVGMLWEHPNGWQLPDGVWQKWIPSKAEVEAKRLIKHEAGVIGNHERWHVGPSGKRSQDCRICIAETIAEGIANGSHGANGVRSQPESQSHRYGSLKPEPEPEPEPIEDPQDSYASDDAVIHRLRIGETAW